jgi:hypothetical protein
METDFHVGADGKARLEEQAQGPNHARRTGRGLLSCSESRRGGEDRWEDRWEATDPNVLGLMLPYIAWDGAPQAQFRPKLARRRVRARQAELPVPAVLGPTGVLIHLRYETPDKMMNVQSPAPARTSL